jgi:hypothetical protein
MSEVSTYAKPPAGALTYDELPFKLRTLNFGVVTTFTAPLMESVIDSKADQLVWTPATFTIAAGDTVWLVTVQHAQGTDRFEFDQASPHALRSWQRWDGSSLRRTQLVRLPYWKLNQPGDEKYLQAPQSGWRFISIRLDFTGGNRANRADAPPLKSEFLRGPRPALRSLCPPVNHRAAPRHQPLLLHCPDGSRGRHPSGARPDVRTIYALTRFVSFQSFPSAAYAISAA